MRLRLIITCLIAQIAISHALWWPDAARFFPHLALWGGINAVPALAEQFLMILLGIVLTGIMAGTSYRWWLCRIAIVLLVVLCSFDLLRCQVWVWFYILVLGIFAQKQRSAHSYPTLLWLLAGIYFWSGVSKISPWFATTNFPWLCSVSRLTEPLGPYPALGYGAACCEVLLGLALVWPRTRRLAQWVAVGFHIALLFVLSPLGLGWNLVVLPWNMAMIIAVLPTAPSTEQSGHSRIGLLVLLLAWGLPVFELVGIGPEAFAWKMYSNTQPEASLHAPNGIQTPEIATVWRQYSTDNTYLELTDWTMAEMQVPPVTGALFWQPLARYWTTVADSGTVTVLHVDRWKSDGVWETVVE